MLSVSPSLAQEMSLGGLSARYLRPLTEHQKAISRIRSPGPCPRRACLARGQAVAGLEQSPLSRSGEEHCPPVQSARASQSVSGPTTIAAAGGAMSLVNAMTTKKQQKPAQNRIGDLLGEEK